MKNTQRASYSAAIALVAVLVSPFVQGFSFFDPVVKWPIATSTSTGDIRLNSGTTSPAGITWNNAFKQAANSWSNNTVFTLVANTGTASHPCAGYPTFPAFPEDLRNGVDFLDTACDDAFGASTLAVTITFFDPDAGTILESDIIFNNAIVWDVYDGNQRAAFDMRRTALHELGHFVGLDHEDVQPAIMQGTLGSNFSLQADDIAGVQALYGSGGGIIPPPSLDAIVMNIESPVQSGSKIGVDTFRGWIVSLVPLTSLKYYVDGVFVKNLDASGTRNDIGNAFPSYPGSAESGFAFAQNWGVLGKGLHTIRIDARDTQGNLLSKSVTFAIDAFDNLFVQDNQVSLNGATVSKSGTDIIINNFLHAGTRYKVTMRWNKQAQSFVIVLVQ